jgi:hypothetical protein
MQIAPVSTPNTEVHQDCDPARRAVQHPDQPSPEMIMRLPKTSAGGDSDY